jgi:hypothetical protein
LIPDVVAAVAAVTLFAKNVSAGLNILLVLVFLYLFRAELPIQKLTRKYEE